MIRGKQCGSWITADRCPGVLSRKSSQNSFSELGVAAKEWLISEKAQNGCHCTTSHEGFLTGATTHHQSF